MTIRDLIRQARETGIAKANGITCVITVSLKSDKELVHFYQGNKRISRLSAALHFD